MGAWPEAHVARARGLAAGSLPLSRRHGTEAHPRAGLSRGDQHGKQLEEFEKRGLDFKVVSSVCGRKLRQYKHYRVFSALFANQTREIQAILQRADRFCMKRMGLLLWKSSL